MVLNGRQQTALVDRFKEMSASVSRMVEATAKAMADSVPRLGALAPVGGATYAPVINVEIYHSGAMSDADARRYGDEIGSRALDTLWKAMNQRGIT